MAYTLQLWNWLENRRSEDDKIFRGMWKAVEVNIKKSRVIETKGKTKK